MIRETKEKVGLNVGITDNNPVVTGRFVRGGTIYKEILLFISEPISHEVTIQEDEIDETRRVNLVKSPII